MLLDWAQRHRVKVATGAGVVAIAAISVFFLTRNEPRSVANLRRASEAGSELQRRSQALIDDLETIVERLRAGADLPERSDEIKELTDSQRESLRALIGILRDQLGALERTQQTLAGTKTAAEDVAGLGDRQRRLLAQALRALDDLEAFAENASDLGATFARDAIYGARLAEDSRDSFSGP